jgi:DNA-binding response OmpR family regulator
MKRVLAVDDDPTILAIEEKVLRGEGYEVVSARDGETALALIREQHFDLLLLDIMMPGVDGFVVSRALRGDAKNRRTPVIFISSRSDAEASREGFRSGGCLYLNKPFSAVQLARLVKAVAGQ